MNTVGRPFAFLLLPVLALGLLAAACTTSRRPAAVVDAHGVSFPRPAQARPIDADTRQRFNAFFLESVRLRLKGDMAGGYELMQHALELNPDAPEALYEMAAYEQMLHPDSASRADSLLRRAVALVPDNFFYRQALADYYFERKQIDSCTAATREMVRLFPERTDLLYNLASIYSGQNKYADLIATLRRIIQADGESEQLSRNLAAAYLAQGKTDSAVAEMQHLVDRTPGEPRYRVELGEMLLQSGQTARAKQIYDSVLAADPDNSYARIAMLNYYQATQQDSLFTPAAEALVLDPHCETMARVAVLRVLVAREQSDPPADTLHLRRLMGRVAAQPNVEAPLLTLYASYQREHGVPTDSMRPMLLHLLSLQPANTDLRNTLLVNLLQADSMAAVAQLCDDGLVQDSANLAYYFYGAIAHSREKQNDRAIGLLERATRQFTPNNLPGICSDIYALLGDLYHEGGRAAAAYAAYDSALSYKPDNLMCLNNYAYFLSLDRQQLSKAERMSHQTVQAEPRNATFLDTYAWILFELGRLDEAKIYIDETLKNADSTENNAALYEHAGDIYVRLGRTAEAVAYWQKALQLGSDSATLRKKLKLRKYIAQ